MAGYFLSDSVGIKGELWTELIHGEFSDDSNLPFVYKSGPQ
jgi:hypothetical protein